MKNFFSLLVYTVTSGFENLIVIKVDVYKNTYLVKNLSLLAVPGRVSLKEQMSQSSLYHALPRTILLMPTNNHSPLSVVIPWFYLTIFCWHQQNLDFVPLAKLGHHWFCLTQSFNTKQQQRSLLYYFSNCDSIEKRTDLNVHALSGGKYLNVDNPFDSKNVEKIANNRKCYWCKQKRVVGFWTMLQKKITKCVCGSVQ